MATDATEPKYPQNLKIKNSELGLMWSELVFNNYTSKKTDVIKLLETRQQ